MTKIRSNRPYAKQVYRYRERTPQIFPVGTYAMCIYTTPTVRRPALEHEFEILPGFYRSEETSAKRLHLKIAKPWILPSQRPIASHPQQDNCKSNEKELASQNFGSFSCISHLLFLIFATKLITITLKRRLLCKQQRTIQRRKPSESLNNS